MDIILSIRPSYARAILAGKKRYEFRKAIFTRSPIDRVYMYASSPVQKILGWFEVDEILEGDPVQVWELVRDGAGIDAAAFFSYFEWRSKAYAIGIRNLHEFATPLDPRAVIPGFSPPQSFCYPDSPLPIE